MSRISARTSRRGVAVAVGVAATLAFSGSAYAYFTGSGAGDGSAKAGVGDTLLSVEATVTTGLLSPANQPGGYKGDLHFTLSSSVNANVSGMAMKPGGVITVIGGKGGTPACLGSVITLDAFSLNINLAAGNPVTGSKTGVVAMNFNAPDSCQGATFRIPVTVIGTAS